MDAISTDWIQTHGGSRFSLSSPDPDDIHIDDIAHALSMQCRFTGHVKQFLSIAQHSVLVAMECPAEYWMDGLLHDAAEAYISDISSPMKNVIGQKWRDAEDRIMRVIAEKFGCTWPMPDPVKEADAKLLVTEARDLLKGGPIDGWTSGLPKPLTSRITPWGQQESERMFLDFYWNVALKYRQNQNPKRANENLGRVNDNLEQALSSRKP